MVSVVLGMLVALALALAVLVLVAVPARRAGREVLSERGEEVVGSLRERAVAVRERGQRTGDAADEREVVGAGSR